MRSINMAHFLRNKPLSVEHQADLRREAEKLFPKNQYPEHAQLIKQIFTKCGNTSLTPTEFKEVLDKANCHDLDEVLLKADEAAGFAGDKALENRLVEEKFPGFFADDDAKVRAYVQTEVHHSLIRLFEEYTILEHALPDYTALSLGLKDHLNDNRIRKGRIRAGAIGGNSPEGNPLSVMRQFLEDIEPGSSTRNAAELYIKTYYARPNEKGVYDPADLICFSRPGTKREIFSKIDIAQYYLHFLESAAKDTGAIGVMEIARAEIHDNEELSFLDKPLQMADYIYQKTLSKLTNEGAEKLRSHVRDTLKTAAKNTGLAIPQIGK